jgi:hypothetical protein
MNPGFPAPSWFEALGRLMEAESETFRRLGFAEVRFCVRIIDDIHGRAIPPTGIAIEGYKLGEVRTVDDAESFDADFSIVGRQEIWRRLLDEISRNGRPEPRHTLNSLVLIGDELWLESSDQLREDKFYRFNQTLQEMFNLAAKLPN